MTATSIEASPAAPGAASERMRDRSLLAERIIDRLDRPLVVLAIVAVVVYLLQLRGIMRAHAVGSSLAMGLDAVFLIDLALKLVVLRGRYLRSAWVLVDVFSCLPALTWLVGVPWMRALRFTRLFRILRVLRGLRVLRSLQHLPGLARRAREQAEEGRRFRVAVNLGVLAYSGAFLGVMTWLHQDLGEDSPTAASAEFFLVLGALLATALFLHLMHHQVNEAAWTQLRSLLNIALPGQVAEHFLRHPNAYQERHRAPATTVFIDFVGFSSTVEQLRTDVSALAQHLERAMDVVVERLVEHDLIVDKFIGDAVMAFRGGPLVRGDAVDHARRVVLASLQSAHMLRDLADPYFSRVKIGIASDECLIGAFGTSRRLSYTVLGDGVNLAARLEPASSQCGAQALVCAETRRLCGDLPGVTWRRWGTIRVKGKASQQVVWEAFETVGLDDPTFIRTYEQARELFEGQGPGPARPLFEQADAERPGGDPPSRLHLTWCDALIAAGEGSGADTALAVAK